MELKNNGIMDFKFEMKWNFTEGADGLYELTFHNCFNLKENNLQSFLGDNQTEL